MVVEVVSGEEKAIVVGNEEVQPKGRDERIFRGI